MPRLVHKPTGLVVTVSDDRAGRLGSEWEPEKAPTARRRKKTADDD